MSGFQKKKVISQEYFDEIVNENINDFEMSRDEAINDAIEQLTTQNADLSGIIIIRDSNNGDDEDSDEFSLTQENFLNGMKRLYQWTRNNNNNNSTKEFSLEELRRILTIVYQMSVDEEKCERDNKCKDDNHENHEHKEQHQHNLRTVFGRNGGISALSRFIADDLTDLFEENCESLSDDDLMLLINTFKSICKNHQENRTRVPLHVMSSLVRILSRDGLFENEITLESEMKLVNNILSFISIICWRTDDNKASFIKNSNGISLLCYLLEKSNSIANRYYVWTMYYYISDLIRSIVGTDDESNKYGGAYEYARDIVKRGVLRILIVGGEEIYSDSLVHLTENKDDETVDNDDENVTDNEENNDNNNEVVNNTNEKKISDGKILVNILLAIRVLAVNDEIVSQIVDNNGLHLASSALSRFTKSTKIARAVLSLFRNVSQNDDYKTRLCNGDGLLMMLQAMTLHPLHALIQEHGIATIASMALRSPSNVRKIMQNDASLVIIRAMQQHPEVINLQRQGCLAIRNIISRNPEFREALLDQGAESILRAAGRFQGAVDEAYAGLRDLGCSAGIVVVNSEGQVEGGIRGFGEKKANFNPVWDDNDQMDNKIQENATAPLAKK